jgi:apolipoprotein N-acyltransferase
MPFSLFARRPLGWPAGIVVCEFQVLIDILFAIFSALLLVFSFPQLNIAFFAWFGLVPLFLAIEGKSLKYSFLLSSICGYLFFAGIFHWILEVPKFTLLHHSILGLYLGSYVGLFGVVFTLLCRRRGFVYALFAAPFVWVAVEYVRSNLSFMALPWGLLSDTQYENPLMIQIASVTGAEGVTFLIVAVNCALAAIVHPLFWHLKRQQAGDYKALSTRARTVLLILAAGLAAATAVFGHMTISNAHTASPQGIKVAVVQGNIEIGKKWDPRGAESIVQTYVELSERAAEEEPVLIVWPESATPRDISRDMKLYRTVVDIVAGRGTYLLLGSSEQQKFRAPVPKKRKHKNSAFLIDPKLGMSKGQRYDKIRLLPFGEYLPYKETIPWHIIHIPDVDDYIPGNRFTVFRLPACQFGVTICWENIFPDLVRQFVKRGAQFIVNITNEAWFGNTAAPYQFVSMSVFRAVENRVFVIRCANTGVSCFIDPWGRITSRVKDDNGKDIFVSGVASEQIFPLQSQTFYTEYGDWLAKLSCVCSIGLLLVAFLRRARKSIELPCHVD